MFVWPTSQKLNPKSMFCFSSDISSMAGGSIRLSVTGASVRRVNQSSRRLGSRLKHKHLLTWVHAAPSCVEHLMASFVISCFVRHVSAGLGERWVMNEYWWDIDPPGLQTEGQISHVDSLAAEVTTRGGGSWWNLKPSDVLCRSWRDLHTDPSVFILQHDL